MDLQAQIERELDELMMGAENYFGAVNPKRQGHIRCALDRIMNHVRTAEATSQNAISTGAPTSAQN